MIEGGVVHDSEEILARCATTTPAGNLSASTSDLVRVRNSDGTEQCFLDALQKAASVNGLSIPVTANRGGNRAGL